MLQVVTELEKREEPVTAMELVKEIYKVGLMVSCQQNLYNPCTLYC